jgi:hypothetical protein
VPSDHLTPLFISSLERLIFFTAFRMPPPRWLRQLRFDGAYVPEAVLVIYANNSTYGHGWDSLAIMIICDNTGPTLAGFAEAFIPDLPRALRTFGP